ncbi:hypothetical protein [Alkalibacillus almallahensis]|uniref:hypothetical protein n=1 Tax=Alkalibacillus almallahensis TaxID=1379154 RepID=UPI0014241C19|nr:hypothetical protein [Alkalibacillus almallahensis]NIK11793.1 hypothetical protein [Alkalibacillus almallahensis]
MNTLKIVKFLYILFSIYILLAIFSTTLSLFYIIPSIIMLWLNYIFFNLGIRSFNLKQTNFNRKAQNTQPLLFRLSKMKLMFVIIIVNVFSILATNYYTGQTPISLMQLFLDGGSQYNQYQEYFRTNNLSQFNLSKIPYVLMLFIIKFVLIYSYITVFTHNKKISKFNLFFIIMISIPHIYFGQARGTNFELFEIVILIIFIIFVRQKIYATKKLNLSNYLKITFVILIMIFIFNFMLGLRGVEFNQHITNDIQYNSNEILPKISQELSIFILSIFNYLGFGFFYTSTYIQEIWFSSSTNLISGFFPGMLNSNLNLTQSVRSLIDVGVKWTPDSMKLIENYGYIGLLLFCFLLGFLSKYTYQSMHSRSVVYIINFLIVLQMFSLPIGKLILTTSATKLIVLVVILILLWEKTIGKKIVL